MAGYPIHGAQRHEWDIRAKLVGGPQKRQLTTYVFNPGVSTTVVLEASIEF